MSGVEDGAANGGGGEFVDTAGSVAQAMLQGTHTQIEEKGSEWQEIATASR